MTTKPHSNEEVIEEGFKLGHIAVPEGSKWLRDVLAHKGKEVADARRVATIEAWNDAIELSDKLEDSDTKFDEWRAFKGFRNGLRDRIRELQTPPDQTANPTN